MPSFHDILIISFSMIGWLLMELSRKERKEYQSHEEEGS